MKFYVTRERSKKSGKDYFALCVDLGYRIAYLNFDKVTCMELLGISLAELYAMDFDEKRYLK